MNYYELKNDRIIIHNDNGYTEIKVSRDDIQSINFANKIKPKNVKELNDKYNLLLEIINDLLTTNPQKEYQPNYINQLQTVLDAM